MTPDPLIALLIAAAVTGVCLWLFYPERGFYWRWQRRRELNERVLREDALKYLYQAELDGEKPTVKILAGTLNISTNQAMNVSTSLQSRELIEIRDSHLHLTSAGQQNALRVIRAHRLFERYLADETGYSETEWHQRANRYEHTLSPEEIESLSTRLGNPTHDPHGDPIPTASGYLVYPQDHIPLTSLEIDQPARIIHLEDEPEVVYAQLIAEGLQVGQEVQVLESSPERIRFWGAGDEHVLAPLVAANIEVVSLPTKRQDEKLTGKRLSEFDSGQDVRVLSLSPGLRGVERRRLMDLGLLPGTIIRVELISAGGDPVAYIVRGALIALRKSQTDLIIVEPLEEESLVA
jgi:DtxR family Mn-dependent transcriptional regulator